MHAYFIRRPLTLWLNFNIACEVYCERTPYGTRAPTRPLPHIEPAGGLLVMWNTGYNSLEVFFLIYSTRLHKYSNPVYANPDITNTYFTLRFCWTPCERLSNLENILDTTHFLIAQKPMGLRACKLIENCCYLQLFCKNSKPHFLDMGLPASWTHLVCWGEHFIEKLCNHKLFSSSINIPRSRVGLLRW